MRKRVGVRVSPSAPIILVKQVRKTANGGLFFELLLEGRIITCNKVASLLAEKAGCHYNVLIIAGWSSLVARRAHNPKVVGSNPAPATKF